MARTAPIVIMFWAVKSAVGGSGRDSSAVTAPSEPPASRTSWTTRAGSAVMPRAASASW